METAHHVVKKCHLTHGARILRHNRVTDVVANALRGLNHLVLEEPRLRTSIGLRKPDLVTFSGNTCYVLDTQIRGDGGDLSQKNRMKESKYQNIGIEEVIKSLKPEWNIVLFNFVGVTLDWRGYIDRTTRTKLSRLRVSNLVLELLIIRTAVGTASCVRMHQKRTG